MNIETAIKNASIELKKNNIKSPQLDCELLMSKVLNKDRKYIILNLKKELEHDLCDRFEKLVSFRSRGKPIAYLIGIKSFWKFEFFTNENVLIPRPDTELLVEQILKIYEKKNFINFLEIGFGSGCIILSLLKEKTSFMGKGVDLSNDCYKLCKINANKLGVSNRLKLFKSDIDNFNLGKYDFIVSNPPYVKNFDLKRLDNDVKVYEPRLALAGGLDGLSSFRKIIDKSSKLLKKQGRLILEIAHDQKKEVVELLIRKNFYINKIAKDLAKNDRCIICTKI
tara:strand:- start:717 stop:1559 length:843 start_codon:yes stop_codon:yes gene_type:complete